MHKRLIGCVSLLLLFMTACSTGSALSEEEIAKQDPENHRIVATTVSVTEIMDQLNLDLIGKPTSYKDLPQRYDQVTEVGNPMSPDMELILSLKPKDVYSVTTLKYDLEEVFDEYDIETNYVNLESIDAMNEEIIALGKKYEREAESKELVNRFEDKVAEIQDKIKDKPSPRVLILMGVPGSYLVATDRSYIGDLVEKCGGTNVFSGESVEYLSSNTEHIQQSDPDIILRAAHGMPDEVVEMFDREFKENDIWKHFDAVKNDRVYDLEELLFGTTANLAVEEALDELYGMLYEDK